MRLVVKSLIEMHRPIEVNVESSESTIGDVKRVIGELKGYPVSIQRIVKSPDVWLEDNSVTLEAYGITEESQLFLILNFEE